MSANYKFDTALEDAKELSAKVSDPAVRDALLKICDAIFRFEDSLKERIVDGGHFKP